MGPEKISRANDAWNSFLRRASVVRGSDRVFGPNRAKPPRAAPPATRPRGSLRAENHKSAAQGRRGQRTVSGRSRTKRTDTPPRLIASDLSGFRPDRSRYTACRVRVATGSVRNPFVRRGKTAGAMGNEGCCSLRNMRRIAQPSSPRKYILVAPLRPFAG